MALLERAAQLGPIARQLGQIGGDPLPARLVGHQPRARAELQRPSFIAEGRFQQGLQRLHAWGRRLAYEVANADNNTAVSMFRDIRCCPNGSWRRPRCNAEFDRAAASAPHRRHGARQTTIPRSDVLDGSARLLAICRIQRHSRIPATERWIGSVSAIWGAPCGIVCRHLIAAGPKAKAPNWSFLRCPSGLNGRIMQR